VEKGFWLKLVGGVLLFGVALFVVLWILGQLLYAFGFLGGLVVTAGILLFIGWRYDKHQESSHG
jgi:hypothetical protein